MLTRVRDWMRSLRGGAASTPTTPREGDVPEDHQVARTRETGGEPGHDGHDNASTTGPGESSEFVGRVAGNDDVGAVGETGAEARARQND